MVQENRIKKTHIGVPPAPVRFVKPVSQHIVMYTPVVVNMVQRSILDLGGEVIEILLKDRTTGRNIIWATDDYSLYGEFFCAENEINIGKHGGIDADMIQPRISKERIKQNLRTKNKAEVFTPAWVCNEQCNLIDEQWFERENIFNYRLNRGWRTNPERIIFPNIKKKTWRDYVDARRLEITCGEAPYLTSRYDAATGDIINIRDRIGFLDRKLRVVNENTDCIDEWFKWVERAYQSTYGYEYQGDSLLLARENLLYSFIENMEYMFNQMPSEKQLQKIATIISWNIWQMDGLTHCIPLSDNCEYTEQLTLFAESSEKPRMFCKIKDWRSKEIIEYVSMLKESNE